MTDKFTNSLIKESVEKLSFVGELAPILASEAAKFQCLQALHKEGKLDFGSVPSSDELPRILHEIKSRVDELLHLSHLSLSDNTIRYLTPQQIFFLNSASAPRVIRTLVKYMVFAGLAGLVSDVHFSTLFPWFAAFGLLSIAKKPLTDAFFYGGHFDGSTIFLRKAKCADLLPIVAHEYGHSILSDMYFGSPESIIADHTFLEEGFARAIERRIANVFGERNPAFQYTMQQNLVGNLYDAYSSTCIRLGLPIDKDLRRACSGGGFGAAPEYVFGNSFFRVEEDKGGEEFLANVLREVMPESFFEQTQSF